MFSVSLQLSGRAGSSATTPASRPRNCGHCSVAETAVSANSVNPTDTITARFIVFPLFTTQRPRVSSLEPQGARHPEQPRLQDARRCSQRSAEGIVLAQYDAGVRRIEDVNASIQVHAANLESPSDAEIQLVPAG